jgi:hypothetical protein
MLHVSFLFGQVEFNFFPSDKHFLPRELNLTYGILKVEGNFYQHSEIDKLQFTLLKNDVLDTSYTIYCNSGNYTSLELKDKRIPFSIEFHPKAERVFYTLEVDAYYKEQKTSIQKASDILVGDVIVIQGQSNAEARKFDGSTSQLESPFVRTFGGSFEWIEQHDKNLNWLDAKGDLGNGNPGAVGQWGLYVAKHLSDSLAYPIAVINGAYGGREIAYFQRNFVSINQTKNNYARLLERLEKSELKSYVRLICWAQGENDAGAKRNIVYYKSQFHKLKADWKKDYPNLEQIYLFQTAFACRVSMYGYVHIAEAQRQLAEEDSMIYLIPTNDLNLHSDACHFPFTNGYERFGDRVLSLILYHSYGIKQKRLRSTPCVLTLERKDSKTLFLTFNESLEHQVGESTHFMLVGKKNQQAKRIEVRANTVTVYFDNHLIGNSLLVYLSAPSRKGNAIKSKKNMPIPTFVMKLN